MSTNAEKVQDDLYTLNKRISRAIGEGDDNERAALYAALLETLPGLSAFAMSGTHSVYTPRLVLSAGEELYDSDEQQREFDWASISRDDPRLSGVHREDNLTTPPFSPPPSIRPTLSIRQQVVVQSNEMKAEQALIANAEQEGSAGREGRAEGEREDGKMEGGSVEVGNETGCSSSNVAVVGGRAGSGVRDGAEDATVGMAEGGSCAGAAMGAMESLITAKKGVTGETESAREKRKMGEDSGRDKRRRSESMAKVKVEEHDVKMVKDEESGRNKRVESGVTSKVAVPASAQAGRTRSLTGRVVAGSSRTGPEGREGRGAAGEGKDKEHRVKEKGKGKEKVMEEGREKQAEVETDTGKGKGKGKGKDKQVEAGKGKLKGKQVEPAKGKGKEPERVKKEEPTVDLRWSDRKGKGKAKREDTEGGKGVPKAKKSKKADIGDDGDPNHPESSCSRCRRLQQDCEVPPFRLACKSCNQVKMKCSLTEVNRRLMKEGPSRDPSQSKSQAPHQRPTPSVSKKRPADSQPASPPAKKKARTTSTTKPSVSKKRPANSRPASPPAKKKARTKSTTTPLKIIEPAVAEPGPSMPAFRALMERVRILEEQLAEERAGRAGRWNRPTEEDMPAQAGTSVESPPLTLASTGRPASSPPALLTDPVPPAVELAPGDPESTPTPAPPHSDWASPAPPTTPPPALPLMPSDSPSAFIADSAPPTNVAPSPPAAEPSPPVLANPSEPVVVNPSQPIVVNPLQLDIIRRSPQAANNDDLRPSPSSPFIDLTLCSRELTPSSPPHLPSTIEEPVDGGPASSAPVNATVGSVEESGEPRSNPLSAAEEPGHVPVIDMAGSTPPPPASTAIVQQQPARLAQIRYMTASARRHTPLGSAEGEEGSEVGSACDAEGEVDDNMDII